MIRFLLMSIVFILAIVVNGFGQNTDQQENPIKKFELRPSSKEYAPVRRGNAYQPVMRSKIPTVSSQQAQVNGRKTISQGNKNLRRNKAAAIRKNRRIRNK